MVLILVSLFKIILQMVFPHVFMFKNYLMFYVVIFSILANWVENETECWNGPIR